MRLVVPNIFGLRFLKTRNIQFWIEEIEVCLFHQYHCSVMSDCSLLVREIIWIYWKMKTVGFVTLLLWPFRHQSLDSDWMWARHIMILCSSWAWRTLLVSVKSLNDITIRHVLKLYKPFQYNNQTEVKLIWPGRRMRKIPTWRNIKTAGSQLKIANLPYVSAINGIHLRSVCNGDIPARIFVWQPLFKTLYIVIIIMKTKWDVDPIMDQTLCFNVG